MKNRRTTCAVLTGAAIALFLQSAAATWQLFTSSAFHESLGYAVAMACLSAPMTLAPGFFAGWLARERGILVGAAAGFLGNSVHSLVLPVFLNSGAGLVAGELARQLPLTLLLAIPSAFFGAAAGGTAQLLRSNKLLHATAQSAEREQ